MDTPNRLPAHAYKCFWDINPADLDVMQYSRYVIERLLEYGDIPELRWLFKNFSREAIIDVLKSSRRFSRRRASSWASYFGIPSKEVKCLNKDYLNQHDSTWNY
jgi:hypothetical protein